MDIKEFYDIWNDGDDRLLVHTSGSTGTPKPMWVEKKRMLISARMTCDFLNLMKGDIALLCMPLDYIAGKMMVVRSIERKLNLITVTPSNHPLDSIDTHITFAAMVPSQVFCSINDPKLQDIEHLIIGGGAISNELAEKLKAFPNAVWSTYGMTETLSHIALRRLSGKDATEWYTPLKGISLSQDDDGCLIIHPDGDESVIDDTLRTNDIVEFAHDNTFRIIGRRDNVICSGGIKIHAEEVERLLQPHLASPFIITKKEDEKFGEAVVLLTEGDTEEARNVCNKILDKYQRPRYYAHINKIPLTETGKPSRIKCYFYAKDI